MPSGQTSPTGPYTVGQSQDLDMTGFFRQGVGATLASTAGVLGTVTNSVHIVSGTNAITGITIPTLVSGLAVDGVQITFIPTGAFTWTTATNIAVAGTAVVSKALTFTYLASTSKWYPSYV